MLACGQALVPQRTSIERCCRPRCDGGAVPRRNYSKRLVTTGRPWLRRVRSAVRCQYARRFPTQRSGLLCREDGSAVHARADHRQDRRSEMGGGSCEGEAWSWCPFRTAIGRPCRRGSNAATADKRVGRGDDVARQDSCARVATPVEELDERVAALTARATTTRASCKWSRLAGRSGDTGAHRSARN